MDQLDLVAVVQLDFCQPRAADDFPVELDHDHAGIESEMDQ
jgi:hypothetical protein